MRIIRAADCLVMPWKNGGGTTTEIAVAPEGASLNDFDWRISMAHVGADGPFSSFPGIDRTLSARSRGRPPEGSVMLGLDPSISGRRERQQAPSRHEILGSALRFARE